MLRVLPQGQRFQPWDGVTPLDPAVSWIELISPTREEEMAVERALGIGLPTREDMVEIEASSRLYQEQGASFLTANIIYRSDEGVPQVDPVTFVLTGDLLVTIRYIEPGSFVTFAAQAEKHPELCPHGITTLIGLLEAVVDRTADVLEKNYAHVERLSAEVFQTNPKPDFASLVTRLGVSQAVNSRLRDSLLSLARLLSFTALAEQLVKRKDCKDRLKTLQRDVSSLLDHASFVAGNQTFLLDAALGLINIDQSGIIKIFSVVSVVFLPPTLVASIYGMNFQHMPELSWPLGYPMALGLMVLSVAAPLWFFKRKGWL